MNVHFDLREPVKSKASDSKNNKHLSTDKNKKYPIQFTAYYNGIRCRFCIGQSVLVSNWDRKSNKVKSNKILTDDSSTYLNEHMEGIRKEAERFYVKEYNSRGIPTKDELKIHLQNFIRHKGKDPNKISLFDFINQFITGKVRTYGKTKSPGTIACYRSVLRHLKNFATSCKYTVDFETINLDFFSKYVEYLRDEEESSHNTIAKDIKILKAIMNEALEHGLTENRTHKSKKFSFTAKDTDGIALSWQEITELYNLDLSYNKTMEECRDLFVFGCTIGQRYSDYSNIKKENIVQQADDTFISMVTQKTKTHIKVPCDDVALSILEKYKRMPNSLPRRVSLKTANENIRQACKEAGFTEKGRLKSDLDKEVWECVSTKTARRSFATHYYKTGELTVADIRHITGHKTEKSFFAYIKISQEDAALKLLSVQKNKKWLQQTTVLQ